MTHPIISSIMDSPSGKQFLGIHITQHVPRSCNENRYTVWQPPDAEQGRGDPQGLNALRADPIYAQRYDDFMTAMVYGKRLDFAAAFDTATVLSKMALVESEA